MLASLVATAGLVVAAMAGTPGAWPLIERDPVKMELVMQLSLVTCSNPEKIGSSERSKDGKRTEIWPIIGGRFEGKGASVARSSRVEATSRCCGPMASKWLTRYIG